MTLDDLKGRYALLWVNGTRPGLLIIDRRSRILVFIWHKNHRPWM